MVAQLNPSPYPERDRGFVVVTAKQRVHVGISDTLSGSRTSQLADDTSNCPTAACPRTARTSRGTPR